MRTLAICRPVPHADMAAFAELLTAEAAALRQLAHRRALLEAYSPGGPGAVLVLDGDLDTARTTLAGLPLMVAGLLDVEFLELHPLLLE